MTGHLDLWLALPFALFLGIAEVVRNWGDWGFWPFWVVDYVTVLGFANTLNARQVGASRSAGGNEGPEEALRE